MPFKIMVIEDDEKLRELVRECLERYGYLPVCVSDFQNIEPQFQQEDPHLVILDITLPYFDGFYLCRIFRRKSKIPILIVSARSGEMDQVMGIELGADDYIIKPFSTELLLAKIKAALRRSYGEYAEPDDRSQCLCVKGITLDESSFRLQYNGDSCDLSKNEFKLVKKFLENRDKILSREELLAELWDDSSFVDDNTLTVNVTRVKNKLANLGIQAAIRTKRGSGYFFDTASMEEEAHAER